MQAVPIEPLGLGAGGPDRQDGDGAKLGCFLDQPIQPVAPDRREQKPEVGFGLWDTDLHGRLQNRAAAASLAQLTKPLARRLIEGGHLRAFPEPQYIPQPVRLSSIELDCYAGREASRDVEAYGGAVRQIALRLSETSCGIKIIA